MASYYLCMSQKSFTKAAKFFGVDKKCIKKYVDQYDEIKN